MARIFSSSNPTLNQKTFTQVQPGTGTMTETGTINKFGLLAALLIASASFTWKAFADGKLVQSWMIGGAIIGFILALVIVFRPIWAYFLAPLYALAEGVFLGAISAFYNDAFSSIAPGIVMQAIALTFGVVIAMFLSYRTGLIRATQGFRNVVMMATIGIAVFYLIAMVLRMFSIDIAFLHEGSWLGIGFSLVVVTIAALNLILDFDTIEQGVANGAPKYMEWYGAFGLMVTIVWLYLEILRLLSKLYSRK